MNPMTLMMSGFMMQNMIMQYMFLQFLQLADPMGLMRKMLDNGDIHKSNEADAGQKGSGLSLGGFEVPASLLQKLLAIDASPEDLEKLQSFLDNFFDKIPN